MQDSPDAAKDVLLTFYVENATQARHYEDQRQAVTTMVAIVAVLAIGLASVALATSPRAASASVVLAGLLMIGAGAFGFLACLRHHERSRLHVERLHAVRAEISRRLPAGILDLYAEATEKHRKRHPTLSERTARVHYIWQALHGGVIVLGGLLALIGLAAR